MASRFGRTASDSEESESVQINKMKVSLLSNETNSLDPLAVHSRIFVGNLNTFEISKSDVEKIFQRYGHLTGIKILAHHEQNGQRLIHHHWPGLVRGVLILTN